MHGEGMYVCGVRWCMWQRRVCMIVAVCVVKVRECVGCGDGRVRGGGGRKLQNCYCFALRVMYIISMNIITVDWRLEFVAQLCLSYLCQNQAPLLLRAPHVQFCYPLWSEMHALLEPLTEKEIYVHDS